MFTALFLTLAITAQSDAVFDGSQAGPFGGGIVERIEERRADRREERKNNNEPKHPRIQKVKKKFVAGLASLGGALFRALLGTISLPWTFSQIAMTGETCALLAVGGLCCLSPIIIGIVALLVFMRNSRRQ